MACPERAYRLLALFRFWNVIHYFYPYKDLLDQDWDTVLPRFVPQFAAARDALEYGQAVAEMAALSASLAMTSVTSMAGSSSELAWHRTSRSGQPSPASALARTKCSCVRCSTCAMGSNQLVTSSTPCL
jgi:hypothetical protein